MGAKSALGGVEQTGGSQASIPQKAIPRVTSVVDTEPAYWRTGLRSKRFRPVKQSTTIRLDADVLVWLKAGGKGYQTRINAILREAMHRGLG